MLDTPPTSRAAPAAIYVLPEPARPPLRRLCRSYGQGRPSAALFIPRNTENKNAFRKAKVAPWLSRDHRDDAPDDRAADSANRRTSDPGSRPAASDWSAVAAAQEPGIRIEG